MNGVKTIIIIIIITNWAFFSYSSLILQLQYLFTSLLLFSPSFLSLSLSLSFDSFDSHVAYTFIIKLLLLLLLLLVELSFLPYRVRACVCVFSFFVRYVEWQQINKQKKKRARIAKRKHKNARNDTMKIRFIVFGIFFSCLVSFYFVLFIKSLERFESNK